MIYKINKFEVDTDLFSITESGVAVAVEPKVFDLIVYLIEHREHLVSRDELFATIWSAREVSDTTLSNHIKSARKILGDNGELQCVIKTIRGRGYQFVAQVEENAAISTIARHSDVLDNSSVAARLPSDLSRLRFRSVIALGAILILAMGFLWHFQPSIFESETVDKRPNVIVLPFRVSSANNAKWQPFADQMTREVIRKLNHVSGLRVVPASSAFIFKQNKSHDFIRQKLPQVNFVLDATISVSGEQNIRISSDMIKLDSSELIWDQAFESKIDTKNVFAIQSKIANSVSDSLKLVLGDKEQHALHAFPTANLEAYELYVQGQQQLNLLTHGSLQRSIALFDQAVALDPEFELAHVAKANAYRIIMSYFETPVDVLPEVISSVRDALKIAPDSPEALSSMGLAYVFAWRWEDAWNMLTAAKVSDSRLAQTELGFALYYSGMGDTEGVYRSLKMANHLDPLNIELADWGHWALAMVGELDAAIQWGKDKIQLHPKVGMIYSGASVSASLNNDHERAIMLAKTGLELDPDSPYAYLALAQAYGYAGDTSKIAPLLEQADKLERFTCPYETAINYILLKDYEHAFELLNQAVASRSNCLVFTRNDQRLAPIKNDPRYDALLIRVGLDDIALASYAR